MDNRPHRPPGLVRWFYAFLNMRYGWIYGSFIAAGLLTVLLLPYITVPLTAENESYGGKTKASSRLLRGKLPAASVPPISADWRQSSPNPTPVVGDTVFLLRLSGTLDGPKIHEFWDGHSNTDITAIRATADIVHQSSDYQMAALDQALSRGSFRVVLDQALSRGSLRAVLLSTAPITQVGLIDAVGITNTNQLVFPRGGSTRMAIKYGVPPANFKPRTNDGLESSALSPITSEVSSQTGGAYTTLKQLSKVFRGNKPKNIVADLNCSGIKVTPAVSQRVLYIGQSLADLRWLIEPILEGLQECNLMLYLEGVPFGSDTTERLQIFADTWRINVKMPPYISGAPIALYAALYAFLVGAIGALSTKIIPWCYTWVVSRQKPEKAAKKPARARAKSTRARRVSR